MKINHHVKDIALILLGNFLLVCSVVYFIIPFEILSGGVAGVAVAIQPLIPIPTPYLINIILISLFIVGTIFLGKQFAIKTLLSTIAYPIFLSIMSNYPITLHISPALASLYTGLLAGVGIGIVFRTNSSTGGMDIPPLVVNKITGINLATLVVITDFATILLGLSTRGIESVLTGLISVLVTGYVVDRVVIAGGHSAKSVMIISDYYMDILPKIHETLNRGATVISAQGGYSGQTKPVLLSVVDAKQYAILQRLVQEIDPNAFLIVTETKEVHGEGFSFEYKI